MDSIHTLRCSTLLYLKYYSKKFKSLDHNIIIGALIRIIFHTTGLVKTFFILSKHIKSENRVLVF